jgi:hypothetical protein
MEPRFSHDFSKVRIHADGRAAESARAVQSNSYTVGSHIVFDSGQYAPASSRGRALLAHELAHVVQQSQVSTAAPGATDLAVVPPDAKSEREADAVQDALGGAGLNGRPELTPSPSPLVQRQTGAEVAGLALAAGGLLQGQVNGKQDGLTFSSSVLQYPKEQARVGPNLKHVSKLAAEFFAGGSVFDNKTKFYLRGEFSDSSAPPTATNRVMSNVYIDVESTTTYYASTLSFAAIGLDTAYGTAADPKLRFVCQGRFDPAGAGDVGYRAVLEIDQHANVNCVEFSLIHGDAFVYQSTTEGFRIELNPGDKKVTDESFQTTDPEFRERINKRKKAEAEWEKTKGDAGF